MELSPIAFSFSRMIDRVMSVVSQKMQEKNQRFTTRIDPAIPRMLWGDDQRLAQVIANLLSNATKFTPEGGSIALGARVLKEEAGACVLELSIEDTGIGMSAEQQGKLFTIFQQAEAGTARKFGGSGLGLAISKRILELMGGDIRVESEEGKGSVFFFTVALGVPKKKDGGPEGSEAESPEEEQDCDFSGKTLLLVDDLEINLEITAALFEPTGATVDMAKSGREAIDAFISDPSRYDLILMDMQMPEMDGLEATRALRRLPFPEAARIPIIAMTANVFREDIEKCLAAGMNDHLGKPVDIREVMKKLRKYLRGEAL
jgi:CheY-like chemotaxis protein